MTPTTVLPTARNRTGAPPMSEKNGTKPEADFAQPHDDAAERAVLGACLAYPAAIDECSTTLTGAAFHDPRHTRIWHALRTLHAGGHPTDPITTRDELRRRGELKPGYLDEIYLFELYRAALGPSAGYHAAILARLARQRRLISVGLQFMQTGRRPDVDDADLDAAYAYARDQLDDVAPANTATSKAVTLEELLAEAGDDDPYDWVVPGLLERHDRVILTGPEGGGKTTLLRQFGVQAAAGIHPFTDHAIPAIRVLHVDLENSRRQSRRRFRPLYLAAGNSLFPAQHWVEVRPGGIDLLHLDEHAWLLGLVDQVQPDLLLTGPLYRMASGDPTEEKTAKAVSIALDRVRDRGCAVVVEAHTPHASGGAKHRPTRPYGASLWLRWPEFGIHIAEDGVISHWRGGRDEREWPSVLVRGGEWPWTPATDDREVKWQRIKAAREEFGETMTIADVVTTTGISQSTAYRIIGPKGRFRDDWAVLNGGGDES